MNMKIFFAEICVMISKAIDSVVKRFPYIDKFKKNECLPKDDPEKSLRNSEISKAIKNSFYEHKKFFKNDFKMNYISCLGNEFKFRGALKYRWIPLLIAGNAYKKISSNKKYSGDKKFFALTYESNWRDDDKRLSREIMDGFIDPLVIFPLEDISSSVVKKLDLPPNSENVAVVDLSCFHGVNGYNGKFIHPVYGVFYKEQASKGGDWLIHSISVIQKDKKHLNFSATSSSKIHWDYAKIALLTAISRHQQQLLHIYYCHVVEEVIALHFTHSLSKNHPAYRLLHYFLRFIHHNALIGRIAVFDEEKSLTASFTALSPNTILDMCHKNFKDDFRQYSLLAHPGRKLNLKYHQYGDKVYSIISTAVRQILDIYYTSKEDFISDSEVRNLFMSMKKGFGDIEGTRISSYSEIPEYDALIEIISNFIYDTVVMHQIGHVGQEIIASNPFLAPASLYRDVPESMDEIDENFLNSLFPNEGNAIQQVFWTNLTCHNYTSLHTSYCNAFSNKASKAIYAKMLEDIRALSKKDEFIASITKQYPFMNTALLSPQTF